ncbi:MAG: IS200/IS605 family transposase [Bacteroidota bacterium]|nr:IS200/IS605 family transposase [Bacteroidota bacterium]
MPNTYTQIYIHIVFVVKGRANLVAEKHREELQKYITGIVSNRGQKLIAIYCMPDHTHVFVGLKPTINISDLTRDMKAGASKFISDNKWIAGKFSWQEGFGAFSHSNDRVSIVANYIHNQKEHHAKKSFRTEYLELLKESDIEYDEKYLFEWID